MRTKATFTPEQKAEMIEAARFAMAPDLDPLLDDREQRIFRERVSRADQARAAEEFKGSGK